jgi:hypothetical protein
MALSLTQQTERRGECTCFPTEKHAPSPAVSKVHRPISSRYVVFDHGYFLGSAVCVPVKPRSKYMPPTSSCPGLSPTPNPKTESNSTRQNTRCILSFDFFIFNFSWFSKNNRWNQNFRQMYIWRRSPTTLGVLTAAGHGGRGAANGRQYWPVGQYLTPRPTTSGNPSAKGHGGSAGLYKGPRPLPPAATPPSLLPSNLRLLTSLERF